MKTRIFLVAGAVLLTSVAEVWAQKMLPETDNLRVQHINRDFPVDELENAAWKNASEVAVNKYWSGQTAPAGRHFKARLLWSDAALYVRFEANQKEPLVISESPVLARKSMGLWDRDVCEIFIAPDRFAPSKYFEFEVAPTGEWIDLAIEVRPDKRITDWDYSSGMTAAAKIEMNKVTMVIRVEWKALGKSPKPGDIWLGNLFRCVGKDPDRGYLAWRPTRTATANFHVPQAFGEFVFVR